MLRIREKLAWGLLAALGLFVVASMTGVVSGGPLDPPAPPGSTDGVRTAGTPINSLPFSITQPGYYYVTRSLTGGTGETGISITADNVTLDLGGFTLTGGTTPGSGIVVNQMPGPRSARNIEIRNGGVAFWSTGINANAAAYSRLHDLASYGNALSGIEMQTAFHSEIWNCNASGNGLIGVRVGYATVRNCTATDNETYGIVGIGDSLIENNKVRNNAIGIGSSEANAVIRNNVVAASENFDIRLENSASNVVGIGNVYCTINLGTGLGHDFSNNVDKTIPC